MTPSENTPILTQDCTSCASLCCIVFAFDKSESFGLDKAAGKACPNLDTENGCRVFETRNQLGFNGCITYTCFGAGQRVTQEVFGGRSWRDDPGLTHRMGAALSVLRRVHEQLVLLRSARDLPLTDDEIRALEGLENRLCTIEPLTEEALSDFPIDEVVSENARFLRSLRHHISS